jgi:hypothetical protein
VGGEEIIKKLHKMQTGDSNHHMIVKESFWSLQVVTSKQIWS